MAINFMDERYLPRIHCDKVSYDRHEVTNLISSSNRGFLEQNRGFLADSFIKPPVTITIKFPCNINIKQVIINGKVGSQMSTAFQLFTSTFRRKSCWLLENSLVDDIATFDDRIYLQVGHGYDIRQNTCLFVNRRFCSGLNASRSSMPCTYEPSDGFQLYHHFTRHLSAVSALAVRVTSTLHGSAVAVGSIEVWGNPADEVPQGIVKHLQLLSTGHLNSASSAEEKKPEAQLYDNHTSQTSSEKANVNTLSDIPVEFLDAITHEVMSLPVLLPSGQTVDQTTLDRYIREEAVWGRPPKDPFTGKTFTSLCRPVQNTPLKVRIDEFFLKYDRTLSKEISVNDSKVLGRGTGTDQKCSRLIEKQVQTLSAKHPITDDPLNNRQTKKIKLNLDQQIVDKELNVSNTRQSDSATGHCKDSLTTSLDAALKAALSNLPSYTKTLDRKSSPHPSKKPQTIDCSLCNTKTLENLYRLKCSHHICRQCLLGILKATTPTHCNICGLAINCHDAVKIHLTTTDLIMT